MSVPQEIPRRADGEAMLSPSLYAVAHGISTRTVRAWLAADELPGAEQNPETDAWLIPVSARRRLRPAP